MGNGYYIVEISSNNSCLFIAAYDVESPESLLIELNENKAEEIMKEFSNDYETMASCLQIMNRRLVLLNPVSILSCINFDRNTISRRISREHRVPILQETGREHKTLMLEESLWCQVALVLAPTIKDCMMLCIIKKCQPRVFPCINIMLQDLIPLGRPFDIIDVDYICDLRLK